MKPSAFTTRQRGAALLILLIMLMGGLAVALTQHGGVVLREQQRTQASLQALQTAKLALLAWSITHADTGGAANARPGELPCPDYDNDGLEDANCAAGLPGRLPWRTLGTEPLRDSSGELLWYVVAAGFRTVAHDAGALNSNTEGPAQLYDATGALMTPAGATLAAVILAPGAALTDPSGRPSNTATAYLDSLPGINNAVAVGPYVTGPVRGTDGAVLLNDIAVGLSAQELIAAAERRALTEAQRALQLFAAANGGKLPNAAAPAEALCLAGVPNVAATVACPAEPGRCSGRLAEDSLAPYAATWFTANGWGRALPYTVSQTRAINASGADCTAALSVNGATKEAVLFGPGSARAGQLRPSAGLNNYLDEAANQDAWTAGVGQPVFVTPASGNDQLRSIP